MSSGLFYLNSLKRSITDINGARLVSIIIMFYRNVCNSNSVNPDQTPRSASSDLGLPVC